MTVRNTLLKNMLWAFFIFCLFSWGATESASEIGFRWFLLGLLIGGPFLGGIAGWLQIRHYQRRLNGSIISLRRDHIGQVFTPELLLLIAIFLLWGVLAVFGGPAEAFKHQSPVINAYRFAGGAIAIMWVVSTTVQLVWLWRRQSKHRTTLLLRYVDKSARTASE